MPASFVWFATPLPRDTRNIILITADGLRWQDLFGGMDPMLKDQKSAGMDGAAALKAKLWRATPEERRNALMPFFWTTLAPKGVVLGNVKKQSSVRVTNTYRVSYPGYSEILTGRAQDEAIRGNDAVQTRPRLYSSFCGASWACHPRRLRCLARGKCFTSSASTSRDRL